MRFNSGFKGLICYWPRRAVAGRYESTEARYKFKNTLSYTIVTISNLASL